MSTAPLFHTATDYKQLTTYINRSDSNRFRVFLEDLFEFPHRSIPTPFLKVFPAKLFHSGNVLFFGN